MGIIVTRLASTPVKGTRLLPVEELELGAGGARGDRRFFVIDRRDRMVNSKTVGQLTSVIADCSADRLRLVFPEGSVIEDKVSLGRPVRARFYSRTVETRLVEGPWSKALSRHIGQPLRLVTGGASIDRGSRGGVSLISRASLQRLAEVAGEEFVDGRRFRMLVEIDGVPAHGEDRWIGLTIGIGEARVRFHGNIGRCLVTSRDPDTGAIDLPTLDILGRYRRREETTEPLPFGIYGQVVKEGRILVGDPVAPVQ
jgi:uncharacterized protein YcbX